MDSPAPVKPPDARGPAQQLDRDLVREPETNHPAELLPDTDLQKPCEVINAYCFNLLNLGGDFCMQQQIIQSYSA